MSAYYAGTQPLTPTSDPGGGFSPRERFWTSNNGGRQSSPDPWASVGYIPQLLPPPSAQDGMTPNYSPASHHSLNNSPPGGSTFNLNIPSQSPYPPAHNGNPPLNGGTTGLMNVVNGNSNGSSDMSSSSFSGPSPPNQAIPLSSPYGAPQNSNSPRSRQYTPSTTPSPHVNPHQTPPNLNGMNGNSHSSHDSSPNPGNFEAYINGGLESGKNGPSETSGCHPNDLPGYLSHPQSLNSTRYSGENKNSDGEMVLQYHQHHSSYYQQNYAPYHQQQSQGYYDSYGSRRPFDPYQVYPNQSNHNQASLYAENSFENNRQLYNSSNSAVPSPSNRTGTGSHNSREPKQHPTGGENGTNKIDPCESLQGGPPRLPGKEGYEEEPNFESVLQGHLKSYQHLDHRPEFNSYESSHYESDRVRHTEESNFQPLQSTSNSGLDRNPSSQDSVKSEDSNNSGSRAPLPSKKEKVKKKRPKARLISDLGPEISKDEDENRKDSLFLGTDDPRSPKAVVRGDVSDASGKVSDERSNSSTSTNCHFSDGGPSNNSPGTNPPNTQSAAFEPKSNPSSKKKKAWKKAKPINSEQLLEERERHCAEYIESTERSLERSKEGKSTVKVKEESQSPYYSHQHSYEERNITIDHQKESEGMKKEVEEKVKDSQSENSSHATTDDEEGKKDKKDVPMVECGCFPVDEVHPEPGPFYTHLGAAHTLPELREMLEIRTGFRGGQLRFEKVIYTGKEGKTSQGCPLAKWVRHPQKISGSGI